jgi:hypothetical protein
MPDVVESYDSFGHALAAGDVTGDGYADLVVNADTEGLSETTSNRGASLTVLRGSSSGLTVTGVQYWTQRTPGVPGSDDPLAFFGTRLAFGDFDHDGRGDIAVASPQENAGGLQWAGAITIFRGSPQGLTVNGLRQLDWQTPGMPASAASKYFYLGDVLHTVRQPDGAASLVVGSWNASVSGLPRAGMVLVFRGAAKIVRAPGRVAVRAGGITVDGVTTWSAADLPVGPQAYAGFGMVLG